MHPPARACTTEYNPAPSPSGHPLLSGPPTLNEYSPNIYPPPEQALGYAETPPDLDVDGIDTAHKLSLVAAVATGCLPNYEAVHTEGIRDISGTCSM